MKGVLGNQILGEPKVSRPHLQLQQVGHLGVYRNIGPRVQPPLKEWQGPNLEDDNVRVNNGGHMSLHCIGLMVVTESQGHTGARWPIIKHIGVCLKRRLGPQRW